MIEVILRPMFIVGALATQPTHISNRHYELPPQSNQWVCRDPHYARGNAYNHDLCDRQGATSN